MESTKRTPRLDDLPASVRAEILDDLPPIEHRALRVVARRLRVPLEELAAVVGAPAWYVSRSLTGARRASADDLRRIREALGVSAADLRHARASTLARELRRRA